MTRSRKIILHVFLVVALALPMTCVLTVWINLHPKTVLLEVTQPPTVNYQSYDPYSVYVMEGPRDWASVEWPRRHRIVVARSGLNPPGYGHMIDYSFHPGSDDVNSHIQKSTAEWTPEGVTFVEATGHRLFIPKSMFVGGR